ncbi:MAG: VWA domain-containing protein [Candidatus Acidiferrales bacterium]
MIRTFSRIETLGSFLLSAFLYCFIFAVALPGTCCAQDASTPATAQQPIRAEAALVKIDAAVLGRESVLVGGLGRQQFRVLSDSTAQPIVYFSPVDAPAQVLVLVETSPAVYLIHNEHLLAAYALLDGLGPGDQTALAAYDSAAHLILGFTADKSALAGAIAGIQYTLGSGGLNFYDSLDAIVASLARMPGKTAVVVLTTGLDSSPPAHWEALVQTLRASDVVIFPVALGGSLRHFEGQKKAGKKSKKDSTPAESDAEENPLSFARADAALQSIAALTGGRAYFPQSADQFVPAYREIAATLRHQYVLGIAPQYDGRFHALTVEVVDAAGQPLSAGAKPQYRVLARQGYLAPQP